ncbi:MAG: 4-(cytidine 5'-diphospho)-2-C-methyl-D-erythritol kinase [Terriglobales bacterium]
MYATLRSFAKINLGLCIGGLRPDGFHELLTVYQTIALHDIVRIEVKRGTGIEIRCQDARVPKDHSNTCSKIVERAMDALKARGRVIIHIEKRLPVQGGIGGASSNAIAALLGLQRALGKQLSGPEKLRIAADVGSDIPLFLIGGTVLGIGRGEQVYPLPDLPSFSCVLALPNISVSTPQAFADWDLSLCGAGALARESSAATTTQPKAEPAELRSPLTGKSARPHTGTAKLTVSDPSDRMNEFSRGLSAWLSNSGVPVGKGRGRAGTPLLDLVRTGIENDFEKVVFPKYPELREAKSVLEGAGALYASLSGSGCAVYGLFESGLGARKAVAALAKHGIAAQETTTLSRPQYWKKFLVPSS